MTVMAPPGWGWMRSPSANNRFTHFQAGGSNDRWETTDTIRLAPQTLLRVESCGFRGTDPDNGGDFSAADLDLMEIRSLAIADAAKAGTADEGACGVMQKDIALPPKPGFVGGSISRCPISARIRRTR